MNILLTGASKGLGLMTTECLLKAGWTVYALSRSKTEELNQLLLQYPDHLKWLQYDLEDGENIRRSVFKDWIGFDTPIHGFVNNAALAYDDIITNLNLDSLEKMYRVNVFSPMVLTKYVLRTNATAPCQRKHRARFIHQCSYRL